MKPHPFRNYLIAGLLVWVPILVTIVVLRFIIDALDSILLLLPKAYHPDHLLGFHLPGLGVILSVLLIILTGLLATNILGKRLVGFGERIVTKIPFVRSLYNGVKQVVETLFSTNSQAFRSALLIEYPRKGVWSICFQTKEESNDVKNPHTGEPMVTVFLPLTPNFTSGFLVMLPKQETVPMDMSVDAAFKMLVSLGITQTEKTPEEQASLTQKNV